MNLSFEVSEQIITRRDSKQVVADSRNFLQAAFAFSDEWTEPIMAVFLRGGAVIHVPIENGVCAVPDEVLAGGGSFGVSAFAGDLVTANTAMVRVMESGYAEEQPHEPSSIPDEYTYVKSFADTKGVQLFKAEGGELFYQKFNGEQWHKITSSVSGGGGGGDISRVEFEQLKSAVEAQAADTVTVQAALTALSGTATSVAVELEAVKSDVAAQPKIIISEDTPDSLGTWDLWFKYSTEVLPSIPPNPLFSYDANTIAGLADGANIDSWTDSASGEFFLTASSSGTVPVYRPEGLNGMPSVQFSGLANSSSLYNYNFPHTGTESFTFYTVLSTADWSPAGGIFDIGTVSSSVMQLKTTSPGQTLSLQMSGSGATVYQNIPAGYITAGVPIVLAVTWNTETIKMYINGSLVKTAAMPYTWVDTRRIRIGNDNTTLYPWRGMISELVFYWGDHTDTQIKSGSEYLMDKWGVS